MPLRETRSARLVEEAALTELFDALKGDETPIIVENVVNRIDWSDISEGSSIPAAFATAPICPALTHSILSVGCEVMVMSRLSGRAGWSSAWLRISAASASGRE